VILGPESFAVVDEEEEGGGGTEEDEVLPGAVGLLLVALLAELVEDGAASELSVTGAPLTSKVCPGIARAGGRSGCPKATASPMTCALVKQKAKAKLSSKKVFFILDRSSS
jgi:hypothetical protein